VIGVRTPRGTGTNGYVATNLANLPKGRRTVKESDWKKIQKQKPQVMAKANKEILEHDKKRNVEIRVMEWAEENGYLDSNLDQDKIDEMMAKARKRITQEEEEREVRMRQQANIRDVMNRGRAGERQLSTHEQAKLREERQIKLAAAFDIEDAKYREGDAFDQEVQEEKKKQRMKDMLKKKKTD